MSRSQHHDPVSPAFRLEMARKLKRFVTLFMMVVIALGVAGGLVIDRALAADEAAAEATATASPASGNWVVCAIAFVVGVGTIGASYAVGKVGSAALGAVSENPDLFGRSLIYVGLAEGLAIYGLLIGIMLLGKL